MEIILVFDYPVKFLRLPNTANEQSFRDDRFGGHTNNAAISPPDVEPCWAALDFRADNIFSVPLPELVGFCANTALGMSMVAIKTKAVIPITTEYTLFISE